MKPKTHGRGAKRAFKCECGYRGTATSETRELEQGEGVWRRRQCLKCGKRFNTIEQRISE